MLLALMVSAVQCATAVYLKRIAFAGPAMHAAWMSKTLTVAASQALAATLRISLSLAEQFQDKQKRLCRSRLSGISAFPAFRAIVDVHTA